MRRSALNHLHLHFVSQSPIKIDDDCDVVECDALKMVREVEKYTCNMKYDII
jgi:hypothetical protein